MPNQVCMNAMMMCTFGVAPSSLVVLPINQGADQPGARREHHGPRSHGEHHAVRDVHRRRLTLRWPLPPPQPWAFSLPCPAFPNTPAPWVPGAVTVLLGNQPTLDNVSTLNCIWGGVIQFTFPGEITVEVP